MATPGNTTPVSVSKGIDNRSAETKVGNGAIREGVNFDIDAGGSFARRRGYTKIVPGDRVHSLWSDARLPFALFVDDTILCAMWNADTVIPVRNGLSPRDMAYAFQAGKVYYSNGVDKGCITPQGEDLDWGVERPSVTFALAPTNAGALSEGRYQVTMSYMNAAREESGAPESLFVDVPEGGGIAVTAIPQPLSPEVVAVRIYLSQTNGDQCFVHRDIPIGMTETVLDYSARGKPLDVQFLAPFPACDILLAYKGRIFGARGKYLFWTDALRYGQYHETRGYMKFGEDITALMAPESSNTELYVGTTKKTYILRGTALDQVSVSIAAHEGVIRGSAITMPGELMGQQDLTTPVPMWMTTKGQFKFGTGQNVFPVKNKEVATAIPDKVATLLTERDSNQNALFSFFGGRPNSLAVTDRAVARVYDNTGQS